MMRLSSLFKIGISTYSHNIFASPTTFPIVSNKIVIRNLSPNFSKQAFSFSTKFQQNGDTSKGEEKESPNEGKKKTFKERIKGVKSKKGFWAGILSAVFGGEALYFFVKRVPSEEEKENAIYHEPEYGYKGDNQYTNTDPRLWKDSSSSDSNLEYKESSYLTKPASQHVKRAYSPFFSPISVSDDEDEVDTYSSRTTERSVRTEDIFMTLKNGYLQSENGSDSEEELTKRPRKTKESNYVVDLDAQREEELEVPSPPITPSTSASSDTSISNGKLAVDSYSPEEEQGDGLEKEKHYASEFDGLKAEYAEEVVEDTDDYGNPLKKMKSEYIPNSAREVQSPIVTSKEIRANLASTVTRDWTRDFLEILEIKDISLRSQKLRDFTNDFVTVAKRVAKVIVQESIKEDWQKTIPTINKGIAGGQKFLSENIFFKFATDLFGIYGGDEFAAKSAAMELRGLNGIINCNVEGVFFPMMCTIDFLGKRVIASSLLPISDETLIYGSEDAGSTVHADDSEFNDKMRRVAGILNLKPHYIKQHTHLKLHLAADVEGHLGKDGKYYCLDTARVFPPEPPSRSVKSSYLYRLLRPELVRKSPVPLSSDAFSGFGVVDKEEHNQEVKEAFDYMIVNLIPQFATQLIQMEKEGKFLTIDEILEELHRRGVNWRYLDIFTREIVHISKDSRYCKLLISEMISRVCKGIMHSIWRESILQGFESTADCLNLIFGDSPKSSGFWGNEEVELRGKKILPLWTKLEIKYPRINEIEYPKLQENLRNEVEHKLIFDLLLKMTGIRIRPIELKFGSTHHNPSPFTGEDILEIEPLVKQLNIVSYLETFSLLENAKSSKETREKDTLFQKAISRIEESVRATPGDSFTLIQFGNILAEWARQKEEINDREALYKRAFQQFEIASSEHNLGVIPDATIRDSVALEAKKLRPLLEVYTNWGVALMEHASDLEKQSLSMAVEILLQSRDKFEFALKKSRVEEPRILYNSAVALSRLLNLKLKLGEDIKTLATLFEKANDQFRRSSKLYKELGSLQRPNVLSDWSQLLFQYAVKLDPLSMESRDMLLSAIKKLEKSEKLLLSPCDPDTLIETLQRLGFISLQVAQRVKEKSRDLLLLAKSTLQRALELCSESDIRRKDLLCNLGFVNMIEASETHTHEKHSCLQEARSIFKQLWDQGDLRGSYNMASLFARESDETNCRHWMEAHVQKFGLSHQLVQQFGDDKDFDSLRDCSWFRELLKTT